MDLSWTWVQGQIRVLQHWKDVNDAVDYSGFYVFVGSVKLSDIQLSSDDLVWLFSQTV